MTYADEIKEHLTVLELENESNIDETKLKRAYLKMSKKYHPDVCEEKFKDGVMFKKVNDANTFIKDNLPTVNDYIQNPSKYQYQHTNAYSSQAQGATYQYSNMNDFFSQFFRQYQRQYQQRTYKEEEIKEMEKRRKRYILKRRIVSGLVLAGSIALAIFAPGLGLTLAFFSILFLI